jgi:biopolymer transport protein ExbD
MRKKRLFHQGDSSSEEGTINLTSLIDVVFVVLIMFIIVAPLLEIDRIELATAAPHTVKQMANVQENSAISIHVHQDNTISLNGARVTLDQLLSSLKRAKAQHPQRIPQLFHDKKAFFGTYQSVKNVVEQAGFEELDVVLNPG